MRHIVTSVRQLLHVFPRGRYRKLHPQDQPVRRYWCRAAVISRWTAAGRTYRQCTRRPTFPLLARTRLFCCQHHRLLGGLQ